VKLRILPEAEHELGDAARWYEDRRPSLGARLLLEVDSALEKVRHNPLGFPVWQEPYRKCLVTRFPFVVFFRATSDEIVVAAVVHVRRRPGYWTAR